MSTRPSIAIVGAGDLGGALASALARRDVAGDVRLLDETAEIAIGKALDIQQAAAVEGFRTRVLGARDLLPAAGAHVIVLADSAGAQAEWQGETGLALLKRLATLNERAILVCAGAEQRGLIVRGVGELHIAGGRLIGSAPGALASAVRALVALEAEGSARDVALALVGVPPDGTVVSWSEATIAGTPLARRLDPTGLRRVMARLPYLWPPGPFGLAVAAADACAAVVTGSQRLLHCFVSIDADVGPRGRIAAMPVALGPSGVVRIVMPGLSAREQVLFENALAIG